MSKYLGDGGLVGKSRFAQKICFATKKDVIKICCLFGSYNVARTDDVIVKDGVIFGGAHNNLAYLDNFDLGEPIVGNNAHLLVKMMKNGEFFFFDDGKYVLSSLYGMYDRIANGEIHAYDVNCKEVQMPEAACFVIIKINGRYITFANTMIFRLVKNDKRTLFFEGLPYITVNESAVRAPVEFLYPKYGSRSTKQSDSQVLLESLKTKFNKALSEFLVSAQKEVFDYYTSLVSNGVEDVKIFELMSDMLPDNLYDLFYKVRLLEEKHPYAALEPELGDYNRSDDIVPIIQENQTTISSFLISSMLFSCGLSIIESINSMVQDGRGASLPGGLSGNFTSSLASSTESQAILVYTVKTSMNEQGVVKPDVLTTVDFEGILDGFVFIRKHGRFWSECDVYVSSRNAPSGDRYELYCLYDHQQQKVYGRRFTYNLKDKTVSARSDFFGTDNLQHFNRENCIEFGVECVIPGYYTSLNKSGVENDIPSLDINVDDFCTKRFK